VEIGVGVLKHAGAFGGSWSATLGVLTIWIVSRRLALGARTAPPTPISTRHLTTASANRGF
jgi:hypothetical protein